MAASETILPKKTIVQYNDQTVLLLYRIEHFTITLALKPNQLSNSLSSYRPISLLPILSEIFETFLLKPYSTRSRRYKYNLT